MPLPCQIIAECASNHGGSLAHAQRMTEAALKAGADLVKFQAYRTAQLSLSDPQYEWLNAAEWSLVDIQQLLKTFPSQVFFTVFDAQRLKELQDLGVTRFKVGHADRWRSFWREGARPHEDWYVSYSWGRDCPIMNALGPRPFTSQHPLTMRALATIPLYPAPLAALAALVSLPGYDEIFTGYSDHTVGLTACRIMMARGAQVIEKHFSDPTCPRHQAWDMTGADLAVLRQWALLCAAGLTGTAHARRWEGGPPHHEP